MNRVRKKHCSNLELPKRGVPKILTTSERRRAVHLVTVGGLETVVQVAKVLREGREVGFCDNTLWSALRDAGLSACEKIPKRGIYLCERRVESGERRAVVGERKIDYSVVIFLEKEPLKPWKSGRLGSRLSLKLTKKIPKL